ncbi:disease resistance protein RPS2-like [Tripterygium wilfordii]|uniref:disease resistance protein RPS2-like n=1 Tax=Tripterygium wilfordii TaxID=458696 RepID=UPI0018F85C6D|nr:disease resistance protein RPS2-like [Tripterygium wilfordii]
MDIVTSIIGKIGECALESIKFQFAYLRTYDDNIVALEHQLEILEEMEKDVHEAIEAAKRNGEVIRKLVQHWITSVEGIKMEAKKFLEDNVKVNKRCFRGWFPDLKTRYSLSKEAVSKNQTIKRLCEEEALFNINVSLPAPPPGIDSMASEDIVLFETTKLAMEEVMAALRDDSTNFVGIHGMGGVGKTTLVKEIARKCKEDKLFDHVAMVVVSQTINVESIQDQIGEFLGLKLGEKGEMLRANRLCDRLKSENKILVILDDVWAKLDLATIGIPLGEDHKGCKVVITTRRRQVCTAMGISVQGTRIVSLDVLTKQESWDLFKLQAGDIINSPTMITMAEKLVKECGGLPIALVTVGNAMRDKDLEEWKEAALELENSRPTNVEDMEKNVFKCIKFSYDYLVDEEAKSCFLLCSLFPEDYNIEIERLVRYGVGLNIFKRIHKIQDARRRAHSIINNLRASSLLVASQAEGCIKMHDVVRDVAKTIALDKYLVKDGEVLKEWPNEMSMDEYNGIGISLTRNEILKYPDAWECPNLEIFLMHDCHLEQEMPEEVFKGMKKLRVLDQNHNYYSRERSLEPSLSHLTNLRTLIIGHSIGPTYFRSRISIPRILIRGISVVGELKMLEVVSFRLCTFEEPLDALRKLKNLRLLDLYSCTNCSSLFNYTRTVAEDWNFSQLQELCVTETMSCSVAELIKCHPRLNVLKICIDDISWTHENFVFPHLDNFVIQVGSNGYDFVGDYFNNILHLDGKYGRLHINMIETLLSGVSILSISRLSGFRNILPHLLVGRDSLGVLKKLRVTECGLEFLINIEEESKIPQPTWFLNLEELQLQRSSNFRGLCGMVLIDLPYSFIRLKKLYIGECHKMLNIGIPFNLLRRMRQLEVLQISYCEAVEYLFDLKEEVENAVEEEEGILVNLREMSLVRLYNLAQLWKGRIGVVHLRNLKIVKIDKCPRLKLLFHWSVAQKLEQLEELSVDYGQELEEIVGWETGEEDTGLVLFRCLKRVKTKYCPKLKVLFRWSVAQRLEQLEELRVFDCQKLEEIVGCETGEEATGLIPFRSLKIVEIHGCSKLKILFHWSMAQRFEQLKELKVSNCNKLEEIVGRETGEDAVHKVLFPELQYLYMRNLPKLVGFYTGDLPGSQSTPKLETVHTTGRLPMVKIAPEGKNLDTIIKDHKGMLKCVLLDFSSSYLCSFIYRTYSSSR